MTGQQDLFGDAQVLARTGDFKSSHEAADRLTKSGARARQKASVLAYVRECPGFTSRELAERYKDDRYMIARRLPDLRKDGLVANGEQRECRVSGGKATTWHPI